MSFHNVGYATIAAGGAFRWGVLINGGQDRGPQYVSAHPFDEGDLQGEKPGMIMTDEQTKIQAVDGHFEYWATFHNQDQYQDVSFTMEGGGFV